MEIRSEGIKSLRRVASIETRLAAIAVDDLRPRNGRTGGLKSSIVLRPPLQVRGTIGRNREALELQG